MSNKIEETYKNIQEGYIARTAAFIVGFSGYTRHRRRRYTALNNRVQNAQNTHTSSQNVTLCIPPADE